MSDIHIKVTPETLTSISSDVTQKVNRAQNAFMELEEVIQSTSHYWEGKGHDAFVAAYQLRKESYMNIFKSFQEHIVNLQQIAGVYQQSENFAESMIQELEADVII